MPFLLVSPGVARNAVTIIGILVCILYSYTFVQTMEKIVLVFALLLSACSCDVFTIFCKPSVVMQSKCFVIVCEK